MKARPILMSSPMIRALLDGRKMQTRRVVKPQPDIQRIVTRAEFCAQSLNPLSTFDCGGYVYVEQANGRVVGLGCPYGKPGDLLWVREAFWCQNDICDHEYCAGCDLGSMLSLGKEYASLQYCATPLHDKLPECKYQQTVSSWEHEPVHGYWWLAPPDDWTGDEVSRRDKGEWSFLPSQYFTKHPSIHMPRWASRLTLELTEVRVERLQDISNDDCFAEGIDPETDETYLIAEHHQLGGVSLRGGTPERCAYAALWESINGSGSWDANPWVWALSFRVHHKNVDALLAERGTA